jgi:competence protein ComEC
MVKKSHVFAVVAVFIIALFAGAILLNGSSLSSFIPSNTPTASSMPTGSIIVSPTPSTGSSLPDGDLLEVIFLDVGQADSILLKTGNHAMLIDAGNTGQDQLLLNYMATYGVTKLDYLVATHPHADHIGAMTSVVKAMDNIDTVIMPDKPHTTKTYENLIKAIDERDIPINVPNPGDIFTMGEATIQVIAPKDAGDADLNEISIVLRVEFGETVFLFTGDAGTKSENIQLASGLPLKADVLKVGHHGSRTSSTQKYLKEVAPSYAVISCGVDNSYGHPHSEAMTRLTGTGATIYRTDEQGTIIFVSDGKTITVYVTHESTSPTPSPSLTAGSLYIGNKNSKIFHLDSCKSLPQEQNRVYFNSRQAALDAGYTPCGTCKP